MRCFYSQSLNDIESNCVSLNVADVHARQLFRHAYRDLSDAPWFGQGLPKKLTQKMSGSFVTDSVAVDQFFESEYDASVKFSLKLNDDSLVEMVIIPEKARITLCVSTQVGCRQGCVFCHTGRMGLIRNLTAGEIVGQVVTAQKWLSTNENWYERSSKNPGALISNVVFMGMGEPLDNVDALIKSIEIMTDPMGLAIAQKKLSVSTSGHIDGLEKLLARFPRVPVAISLHETDDTRRSKIMPINRRWPLAELIEMIRKINILNPRGSVLIQYTLISGVNDSLQQASALADLLEGLRVKVNLIPLNEIEPSRFQRPDEDGVALFRDYLHSRGYRVMVRYSKGLDIVAACGQLIS